MSRLGYRRRGRDRRPRREEAKMGVITDYFCAPGVAAVLEKMTQRDGGPLVGENSDSSAFDGVELKGVDPPVVLGRLVAFAMGVAYHSDVVKNRLIWPEGVEQDAEYMGPWVAALDDRTRDTLAGIPAQQMPGLAEQWGCTARKQGFGV